MKRSLPLIGALLGTLALAACEAPTTSQEAQAGSVRALFQEPPKDLFRGVEQICQRPTDTLRKVSDARIECRRKMSPRATAGAILAFGGTVQDLPESVMRLDTRRRANGYLVEGSYFLVVPREGKPDLVVRQDNDDVNQRFRRIFARLGGQPVR